MSKPQDTTVHCFTCGHSLQVSVSPVPVYVPGEGLQLRPPRLAAPFICEVCREDNTKFQAAREEMFKYIGQAEIQEKFDG